MLSLVMLALGSYRFSVATGGFQGTERDTEWRWVEQEVIGAAPALQYVGPGSDTISINGVIFSHYRGGIGQVDTMRAQAGLGRPLPLVDGTGRYYGPHVITKIREGRTAFLSNGAPRKIEFGVELKRYA